MTNERLVEENMSLVYFIVKRYYPTFTRDEDIIQVGLLALCNAANTWDESKTKFSTYAGHCIRNAINNELRNRKKYRNTLSLDYEVVGEDGEIGKFGDFYVGQTDVEYVDADTFYEQLTPKEKEIVRLRKAGLSVDNIAEELGYSKSSVWSSLRKIKSLWGCSI